MEPDWIIAISAALTLVFGTMFSAYKFMLKVRGERAAALENSRASAQEALRIAREETQAERDRYQKSLLRQIGELQEDRSNKQRDLEDLQRRYEELLARKGNPNG